MKRFLLLSALGVLFATTASADSIMLRVTVDESTPVYRTVTKEIPRQECYNEEYEVAVSCGHEYENSRNSGIGIDTLIGATAGVIIGNQFKHHSDAAKVIGGVGGAIIANNMRHNRHSNAPQCYETRVRKKCKTYYDHESEERIVSYKNCGYIGGKKICKRTHRKLDSFIVYVTTE